MTSSKELRRPALDPEAEESRIGGFLREQLREPPRHAGFVVGLSGGVDSALTAALACSAVGPSRVLGVLLPERESQPESLVLGRELAEQLGIDTVEEDLTEVLSVLGIYGRREDVVRRYFPSFGPDWRFRLRLPGDLRSSRQLNVYQLEVVDPAGEVQRHRLSLSAYREIMAATSVKQRLRMVRLYEHAERRGYLVCGTTNRTELIQGFFVRYGDGGVDLEPLAHLYKTEVFELARHMEVPPRIVTRTPSPDTFSAPVSDEEFYFRLPYEDLDQVLACFEGGRSPAAAAAEVGLSEAETARVYHELTRRQAATRPLRQLPPGLSPASDPGGAG